MTSGLAPLLWYIPDAALPDHMALASLFSSVLTWENPETEETNDLACDLCTSWKLSPDGRSYTYFLNEKARWWDGKPVTAVDVVFTLDSITDPNKPEFGDVWKGHKGRPTAGAIGPYYESSRAIDEHTVEVKLKFPSASWHTAAFGLEHVAVLPKHTVLGEGKLQGLLEPQNLNGSGPFKLTKFVKDVSLEYEKNKDYWKEGRPYLDGMVRFIITDAGTALAALATEQVVMTTSSGRALSAIEAKRFQEQHGDRYNVYFVGPVFRYMLMLNTTRKPFDNPKVRRAIELAMHRQAIMETVGVGDLIPGLPLAPGLWFSRSLEETATQVPGFRESAPGVKHPDDIAEARKLLAEAGVPSGFKIELTTGRGGKNVDTATLVAEQLKKFLDLEVNLKVLEWTASIAAYGAGDFQTAVQFAGGAWDPDIAFLLRYRKTSISANWTHGENATNWARVQELYQAQQRELDPVKRVALLRQIEDLILEDDVTPGIYWDTQSPIVHKKIKNFHPSPLAGHKWEHIWCDPKC